MIGLITPTFKPHFKFIKKYLDSYDKFVVDKNKIEIIFTIDKEESNDLKIILKHYKNLKYKIVYFEDLLFKKFVTEMHEKKYIFNKDSMPDFILAELKNDAGMIGTTLI